MKRSAGKPCRALPAGPRLTFTRVFLLPPSTTLYPSPPPPPTLLSTAQWEESGVRVRGGVLGKQLHGAGLGQVQRLVPGLQSEGPAQKRLTDGADATGSAFHEALAAGQNGPYGRRVPFHHGNQTDAKGEALKTEPQEKLTPVIVPLTHCVSKETFSGLKKKKRLKDCCHKEKNRWTMGEG